MQFPQFICKLNDFAGRYESFPRFNNLNINSYYSDQQNLFIQDSYNRSKTESYSSPELSSFLKLSVYESLVCDFLFKTLLHNESVMFVDFGNKAANEPVMHKVVFLGSPRVVGGVFQLDIVETQEDLKFHLTSGVNLRAIVFSGISSSKNYIRVMDTILDFGSLPYLLMGSAPTSARRDIQQYSNQLQNNHSMMYFPFYLKNSIVSKLSAMLWCFSFKEKRVYSFSQRFLLKLWRKYSSEVFVYYSN